MDRYQIIPKKQLGLFILNSTMSDNKHLNNQYGKITYEGIMGASAESFDTLKEIYSKLGLDTTDIDEVKDFYLNGEKNTTYQVFYESGISLIYINEKLWEITAYKECEDLNFNNHFIFKENPQDIIDQFCIQLKEYPFINQEDIYFYKNQITFWSFSKDVTSDGKVVWTDENSELYSEKSIIIYAGQRNNDQTYDDYNVYKPLST